MKLAIADPPYLGRAALWYGGKGITKWPGHQPRSKGRGPNSVEYHPDAARWDDPVEHIALMSHMEREYDGWALAASSKTLAPIIGVADLHGARLAVWQVTNAIPDGARVRSTWEAVFVRVPDGRRAATAGMTVPDVLTAPHPMSGHVGAKPAAWTRWVLDMLGYRPDEDELDDLFPGSGAVAHAAAVLF